MAILKFSSDHGAAIYHNGCSPDINMLTLDGRIRETYDPNDLSAGDYTYSRDDQTFRLTGTGEILWVWDGQMFSRPLPDNELSIYLTLCTIRNVLMEGDIDNRDAEEIAKKIILTLIRERMAKF